MLNEMFDLNQNCFLLFCVFALTCVSQPSPGDIMHILFTITSSYCEKSSAAKLCFSLQSSINERYKLNRTGAGWLQDTQRMNMTACYKDAFPVLFGFVYPSSRQKTNFFFITSCVVNLQRVGSSCDCLIFRDGVCMCLISPRGQDS